MGKQQNMANTSPTINAANVVLYENVFKNQEKRRTRCNGVNALCSHSSDDGGEKTM